MMKFPPFQINNIKQKNAKNQVATKMESLKIDSVDMLPCYQFDLLLNPQSVVRVSSYETLTLPPEYSEESETSAIDELIGPSHNSYDNISYEVRELQYLDDAEDIGLEIQCDNPGKQIYTNSDKITGKVTISNKSQIEFPFGILIVSLEGKFHQRPRLTQFSTCKNFLYIVDPSCSLINGNDELKVIPRETIPLQTILEIPFQFYIPTLSLPDDDNKNHLSQGSLPPSIGLAHFLQPKLKSANIESQFEEYRKGKFDLNENTHSISYSINAKLLTKSTMIIKHLETFFKFIPSATCPSYFHPEQQLKLFIKLIKHEIKQHQCLAKKLPYSPTDPEKLRNLTNQLYPEFSRVSSCNSKISYNPSTEFSTRKFLFSKNQFFHTGPINGTKCGLEISSSGIHNPLIMNCNCDSNEIEFKLKLKLEIPFAIKKTTIKPIDDHNFQLSLVIKKLYCQSGILPIQLDPSWLVNKETINMAIRQPLQENINLLRSLPKNSKIPKNLVDGINGLGNISNLTKHSFSQALKIQYEQSDWQYELNHGNTMQISSDVIVKLKINPAFSSKYACIPTFQTSNLFRFYYLNLNFNVEKIFPKSVLLKYQCMDPDLILEIPLEVQYREG